MIPKSPQILQRQITPMTGIVISSEPLLPRFMPCGRHLPCSGRILVVTYSTVLDILVQHWPRLFLPAA